MQEKNNNFSVALGLTDYINPVLYSITSLIIIFNINNIMNLPYNIIYIISVILSLIFGFLIPTVKLLVGLGKIEFKLPISFVFLVNLGIFISGLMLIKNIMDLNIISIILITILILSIIYFKTKKFNNIAVLIGAIGYLLIYISLIKLSISSSYISIIFYIMAICIYIILIIIGIKGNLKDARVHWVIEISNIICQALVALATFILFI